MATNSHALAHALRAAREGLDTDLERLGESLLADLRASIAEPYPPASAPGNPPHLRTGDLQASYEIEVSQDETGALLELSSPLDYSVYTEFGTRRMAPRPHVRPAVARHSGAVGEATARGIEQRESGHA